MIIFITTPNFKASNNNTIFHRQASKNYASVKRINYISILVKFPKLITLVKIFLCYILGIIIITIPLLGSSTLCWHCFEHNRQFLALGIILA